jgi:DNA primase
MMETIVAEIKDTFHSPNLKSSSTAKCPWHKEITASLLADHSKGIFHCISCGVEGILVEGTDEQFLVLQREYK